MPADLTKNRSGDNIVFNYTNADNKIESVTLNGSNYPFAYDTKGSVTNDGLNNTLLGNYSFRNLPTTMNNFSYTYNDSGERIKKQNVDSLQSEYYLRDYLGRELVIYNYETNDPKQINIYGNGLVGKIEIDTTETRSYYLKDHLGSVRSVVDNNSGVVSAQDYYPYGETIRQYNNSKYMLTEKERDNETNYDYFGARYYNSKLGVWLQVDPLAEKYPGWSPYNYALCNPMRFVDPKGSYLAETADGSDPEGKEKEKRSEQNNTFRQLNYATPQDLSPELAFSFIIKMKLIYAEMIAKEVLVETQSKASELPGGTKGLHNGPADAWRHARWNERMVKEIDPITAFVAGVGHELENLFNGGPLDEILMDLHNNAVGRSGESPDKLLKEGKLRIIQKPFTNKGQRYYP